jgi:sugar phosphate isomerase/epimerase
MNFAVSTTAFRRKPIEDVLELAAREGLALEFSSGLPYREDMEAIYLAARVPRLPHNYFPAPKTPFVLNLGSLDPEIRSKSIAHCKRGLRLAAASNAPFFSAHAGFCLDPEPKELGRPLRLQMRAPREEHWLAFTGALRELTAEAEHLGVRFLVENNVVAKFNLLPDGSSPLLCCEHTEIERMRVDVPGAALGCLLDTGHLKVSAGALGFSADEYMRRVGHTIQAIHHSDNDGSADSNEPLTPAYWFLSHMPRFEAAWHVLEVHDQTVEQIKIQFGLLRQAAAGQKP